MAAYAALVSLTTILEQIQNHRRLSASVDNNQIESLVKVVDILQHFLENCSREEAAQVLENQIAAVAYAAEDVIETHIVDQISSETISFFEKICKAISCFCLERNSSSISLLDLTNVIEEMDLIHQKAMKVQEETGDKKSRPTNSTSAASSRPLGKTKSMVGFDDKLIWLMDKLEGGQPERKVVLIHGMGGIGKTTLTRNAYENPLIVHHFDTRTWSTISQTYNVNRILCDLLPPEKEKEYQKKEEAELGEQLYKNLFGRRYLVVLDDMWSVDAWDRIRSFLPDNNNGSRVVITTRQSHMSISLGCYSFSMRFLDEDQSWKLFCEKVFAQEGCPPEFEKIGKKIANSCKGLPLSITVIGGFLRKSSRTLKNWESIAKDINSFLSSREDEQCSSILSFSYDYLPVHLKPCLLYMGTFKEDVVIDASQLVECWVAEGFLKPNKSQRLETVAEGYLQDLLDRNLILVSKDDFWLGKIKCFKIHDLVRELCLKVAKKENFIGFVDLNLPKIDSQLRGIVLPHYIFDHRGKLVVPLVRSLICYMYHNTFDIFDYVNVRYISYVIYREKISYLPQSISRLWNLQMLIFKGFYDVVVAPIEVWDMPQLRHIHFSPGGISLPIPPCNKHGDDQVGVLVNLQTLEKVVNLPMSEEVRRRISNSKQLHLKYHMSRRVRYHPLKYRYVTIRYRGTESQGRISLEGLDELESLTIEGVSWDYPWLKQYKWPTSLKELNLSSVNLCYEDLTTMGSLPLLEVLYLRNSLIRGEEWNPIDGEFRSLKHLWIQGIQNLIHWNAESSHFPKLEKLHLEDAYHLEEIPSGIGNIPTLELIELVNCSVSSAISAMKVVEEQEGYGNEDLKVEVEFFHKKLFDMFMEEVAQDSFTSNNFIIRPIIRYRS